MAPGPLLARWPDSLSAEPLSVAARGDGTVPETDPTSEPRRPGSSYRPLPDAKSLGLSLSFLVCKMGQRDHPPHQARAKCTCP